jgi:hypothetical protein
MATVQEIEEGRHIVTAQEAPIYSVCRCGDHDSSLCLRRLEADEKTCSFSLPITSGLPAWLSDRLTTLRSQRAAHIAAATR